MTSPNRTCHLNLPLHDVVVVDLTQIYNGPYATYLLALSGATVIKIEPPGGEALRRRGTAGGAALPFAMLNGCKEAIVLDLKSDAGKSALLGLVQSADVLVENFAPGAMTRLGLDFDVLREINPRLIYAASSGFGSDGPYRHYPAMDLTVQAVAGIMHTTGFPDRPPVKSGPAICDFMAGIHLYGAITTALYARERTGVGSRVEVAMQDAVYASISSALGMHWASKVAGETAPARTGNRHSGLSESPYNVYPAKDGFVAIMSVGEQHWRSLTAAMGREELADDPRFATVRNRMTRLDEVDALVSEWTQQRGKQQIFEMLMDRHVPCAPVRDLDEVINDENMHGRGALERQEHPEFGSIVVQQSPLYFHGLKRRELVPSRKLSEDTARVLSEKLGWSEQQIATATRAPAGVKR